jgi:hypothetical protein
VQFVHFLLGRFVWRFLEPFRQESLSCQPGEYLVPNFEAALEEDVSRLGHHGDAESERHSGSGFRGIERCVEESDFRDIHGTKFF